MNEKNDATNKFEAALNTVLKVPGVKVDRNEFLRKELSKFLSKEMINKAIDSNTIEAGIDIEILNKISNNIINKRTKQTAVASFVAGLPGGFAITATIPVDILQFFAIALKIAQELAYIYGFEELWKDNKKIKNEVTLFLGAMFGIGGAATTLRMISTKLSIKALETIPQKALSKTIYNSIVKKIAAKIGIKMTKDTFAKGVSKAIPILGGIISGGITYVSMKPMGNRLRAVLIMSISQKYTEEDFNKDIKTLEIEAGEYMNI
jgi:hypothetical protein